MRTRLYGGVAGENGRPFPLCRFVRAMSPWTNEFSEVEWQAATIVDAAGVIEDILTMFREFSRLRIY
jgi:hypothetical protein